MPSSKADEGDLLMFFGTDCEHCHEMDPLVEKMEKELKIQLTKLEVWDHIDNARIMEKYDKNYCGGVPFFFNKKTGKWICGSTSYEKLKAWALGK